jgi:hypothetical protein
MVRYFGIRPVQYQVRAVDCIASHRDASLGLMRCDGSIQEADGSYVPLFTGERCIYLFPHRSWADFFLSYVVPQPLLVATSSQPNPMSRLRCTQ